MRRWLVIFLGLPVLAQPTGYFAQFPQLVRSATSNNSSTFDYARYTFELAVPAGSGSALGGVVMGIPQGLRVPESGMVSAVVAGQTLVTQVAVVGRAVTVTFPQPVAPGQGVSLQLYPMSNPRLGGTHLFEIAVFPAGNPTGPQFLGFGRLSFLQKGSR
ncbi:DUF2808 domain-containing protein [Candidatus Cyanaurora vandensis]|uniref:DUF2808 domain-containing protein n=1 Tax=Candidatus Cyanaurora vandensis TaxID=2714958 RepID=UPI0025799275|nr:DUF2808 domain-containing protein [Candidatus Cyanaurora vandensis]